MSYRLYLLNGPRIRARQELAIDDDQAALLAADCIYDSLSDVVTGVEVWNRNRLVGHAKLLREGEYERVAAAYRNTIVEVEMRLRDSNAAIARSKRLLARLEEQPPADGSFASPAPEARSAPGGSR
jgi:hypothetical protein